MERRAIGCSRVCLAGVLFVFRKETYREFPPELYMMSPFVVDRPELVRRCGINRCCLISTILKFHYPLKRVGYPHLPYSQASRNDAEPCGDIEQESSVNMSFPREEAADAESSFTRPGLLVSGRRAVRRPRCRLGAIRG